MRYWVYQGSRILGPFAKEDLASVPGLSPDSLVCQSDASGIRDDEWRAMSALEELSGMAHSGALAPAFEGGTGSSDSWIDDAHAAIDKIGYQGEYASSLIEPQSIFDSFAGVPGQYGGDAVVRAERMRSADLEQTMQELNERIADFEVRQDDILGRLSAKDKELAAKDEELEALRDQIGRAAPPEEDVDTLKARLATLEAMRKAKAPPEVVPSEEPVVEAPAPEPTKPKPPVASSGLASTSAPPVEGFAPPLPDAEAPTADVSDEVAEKDKQLEHQKKALVLMRAKIAALEAKKAAEQSHAEVAESEIAGDKEAGPPPLAVGAPLEKAEKVPEIPTLEKTEEPETPPEISVGTPIVGAKSETPVPDADVPQTESLAPTAGLPPTEAFTPPTPEDVPEEVGAPPELSIPEPAASPAGGVQAPDITIGPPGVQAPVQVEVEPAGVDMAAPVVAASEPPPTAGQQLQPPHTQAPVLGAPPPSAVEGPPPGGPVPDSDVPGTPEEMVDGGAGTKPKTMMFNKPPLVGGEMPTPVPGEGPAPMPGQTPTLVPDATATPMPIPLGGAATPTPMPLPGQTPTPMPMPGQTPTPMPMPGQTPTPMPQMGQPDIPHTVLQGMGVGGATTPMPGTPPPAQTGSFDDMIGKPTTVPPGQTAAMKTGLITGPATTSGPAGTAAPEAPPSKLKRLQSKGFLIAIGVAGVVLVLLMMYFLKDPKKIKQMVEMSPEQQAQGSINMDNPQGPPGGIPQRPSGAAPAAQSPQAPPVVQQQPAPPVQQAPPPIEEAVEDPEVVALDLIKNYMLDEKRGTISQELDFRYPPPSMPEWRPAGVGKDMWLVEFLVFANIRAKKPRVRYTFEVNLQTQQVIGRNDNAKGILAGKAAAKPKPKPRRRTKRKARASSRPKRNVETGQIPLPDESDLDGFQSAPPAGFNNPGGN